MTRARSGCRSDRTVTREPDTAARTCPPDAVK
jgi:hypothetical protein